MTIRLYQYDDAALGWRAGIMSDQASTRLTWRQRLRKSGTVIGTASDGIGTWFLSIVLCILVPCLPVGIEMLRAGHVPAASYFVTAAVLSATYGCSAEHNFYRGLYTLSFIGSLLLDAFGVQAGVQNPPVSEYAGLVLAGVVILHSAERFWWHVIWDRPFPDFLRRMTP